MAGDDSELELPRVSTGSAGLDTVLGGGVDPNRMYLYEGRPGSGKTTLALQFLLEGARRGEHVLYITLSETERELRLVAKRHGWSLEGVTVFELVPPETSLDPTQELTVLHPAELELSETTQMIFDAVERLSPTRIVVDSLSELRLLAQSPLRYRRQILALKHFFSGRTSTVVLLDDLTATQNDMQLHSIAHGVVLLEQHAIDYGAERRRMRVVKMRGIDFKGGYHDFTIARGGLNIFPRLVAAEHHKDFEGELVPSGNAELDLMLGGGLEAGTNALLIGSAGVGKSSLALTYAIAAAARGERSVIFAFDEGKGTMSARARTLGLPLDEAVKAGMIRVEQIDPAELAPGEFADRVRKSVESDGVRIVIIDSLNGYLNAMPDERFLILQMHELLSYLSQLGVLTILVLAQHGLVGPMDTPVDISYLADAVIMLRYFEYDGLVRRALSVVKKRSGHHEHSIREFKLGGQGVQVGPPLTGFSGIFAGTPTYVGEAAPLCLQTSMRSDLAPHSDPGDETIVVLAPIGRDASAIGVLVERLGPSVEIASGLDDLLLRIKSDVTAAVVAEEALYGKSLEALAAWVDAQPPWSDQPFIILTNHNAGPGFTAFRQRLVALLRNVSFLERPLHAMTLQASVQTARRARARQRQARAYLESQRDTAAELERLVAIRTAELEAANARLREEMTRGEQAQAALLQAQKIETMGQLVGGVAHDFNNLLMAVIGNLDLLSRRIEPDERLLRLVDGALEGARRGATLTQRLLAFARKQELQAQATDALALVNDMRGLIDRSLGPLIQVQVEPQGDLPVVTIDPNQLEMALLNLAVNARDAMPQGGAVTITLQAETMAAGSESPLPPGRYLRLCVSDTGEGMDPETLERAVEPFFSTKGVGKGTGLGLSMVHGLANQSGGAFRLSSTPGKGTNATLWLPAAEGAAEPPAAPQERPAATAPSILLLVDDDPLIAASAHALLEDLGHQVVEANSGEEALAAIDGGLHPDLVITDHAMPGMTGTELAGHIRSRRPGVPILLATGYADLDQNEPSDLPRLAKPYTQDQLAREIGRLLPGITPKPN